jgi:Tfp pilus assembly protein PilF
LSADRTDDALTTLREARARFARRAGGNFTIEYYTALAHTRRKDYVAALKSFTAAEVIARATETNRLTPFLYFQIGAAHERNKNYEDAETYFKKSLRLDDDFAEAHNYLGYMWAERGVHLEAAKRHIEDALRLEPKNGAYLDSLGWVLHKQGRHEEALRQLLDALKYTEKPDATLHDHLGDIHAALKQRDRAVAEWKRSLEIEPNDDVRRKLDAATASP